MGMPVLEAESRDRAYSVTGVERISGDPASGPAMDGAEVGKKENEQYKGSIQADSENIGTKEVSLEERKIEEIHAEEPAPEILYEIELESDADDSFSVLRQEDIQFSGLGAVCSKAVRKDNGTTLLLTIELQDAGEIIGTVDAADWEKRGIGRWKKAPGASAYLVMLYRDAKRVGHPHRTSAEQYDFVPLMQTAGVYDSFDKAGKAWSGSRIGMEESDGGRGSSKPGRMGREKAGMAARRGNSIVYFKRWCIPADGFSFDWGKV